ncbi:uncharacterized protein A4U43_C01F10600 [Asparagus officinalis]|uniref:Uncharacterized protein n=1 Tax=Asparagus officinalis TaxID=4686 RepID=A0A5P1FP79_ASPOF|nr:uncharacterized protein A4U43_C01F10600 [Asparagus officinalis]
MKRTGHVARTEAELLRAKLNEEVILQETLHQEVARVTTEAEQQHNSLHAQVRELETQMGHLESKSVGDCSIEKYHDNYLANYLDVLKTLKVQGGLGIVLEDDEGAEEDGEKEATGKMLVRPR